MSARVELALLEFCTRVYEATCAIPSRVVLPAVAFDTLRADLAPRMRLDDGLEGDWPAAPIIMVETDQGRVVIERGNR